MFLTIFFMDDHSLSVFQYCLADRGAIGIEPVQREGDQ